MSQFATRLIEWHQRHGRHDLPWQGTRDPYRIWVSEIMLQQTQVRTVVPYYTRFLAHFPDVAALAAAPLEEVLAAWAGLGYYARARNLHRCARRVVAEHGGAFPRDPEAIARLPGIGRSTAAAIAAFAHGTRAPILDGNVKRVLCRCFGIAGFPGDKRVEQHLWELADSLLPSNRIETYTQGLMDLGAIVCTRARPDCLRCPLRDQCVARREQRIAELPMPRARRERPRKTATVLILLHGDRVLLERRPPTGIWGGLLALPEAERGPASLHEDVRQRLGCRIESTRELASLRHAFSHFVLEMRPLLCRVVPAADTVREDRLHWLSLHETEEAALPAPVKKLLRQIATPILV
jgi:A/G-specific adenine glycosylase